jgi:hypothetical protein
VRRTLSPFRIPKDILVYTADEVAKWQSTISSPALYVRGSWSMSGVEHVREMLTLAQRDFKALQGILDAETFAYEIFGFHAQQTVENL